MNGATGAILCEVYDLAPSASRVGNISTRGHISDTDSVLIGGFILGG